MAGLYTITVQNPDGQTSIPFTFSVPVPLPNPVITSISPSTVAASGSTPRLLTVSGSGFQSFPTVKVTFPSGSQLPLTPVGFANDGIEISVVAHERGTYSVAVTNPEGKSSNSFPFSAQ